MVYLLVTTGDCARLLETQTLIEKLKASGKRNQPNPPFKTHTQPGRAMELRVKGKRLSDSLQDLTRWGYVAQALGWD